MKLGGVGIPREGGQEEKSLPESLGRQNCHPLRDAGSGWGKQRATGKARITEFTRKACLKRFYKGVHSRLGLFLSVTQIILTCSQTLRTTAQVHSLIWGGGGRRKPRQCLEKRLFMYSFRQSYVLYIPL